MTFRTDDERKELMRFIQWVNEHEYGKNTPAIDALLVEEYLKDREQEHAWGKVREDK